MTRQEFIEEIRQLSIADRIALLEEITRSLREDLEANGTGRATTIEETSEANIQNEHERKLAAVQRLRGILKSSGKPPSDEELKEDYTNYLIEKYS
jgi:hypothetical protein